MQRMDDALNLVRLESLVSREQKNQWERFGFSPEWSFRILPLSEEGENAEKYLVAFFSKGGAPEKKVFLKRYLHPQIDRLTVENEFQGLRLTYEAFKETDHFRVPQPYGRLLDEKIIFMEHYPSVSLKRVLFHPLRISRFFLPGESRETLFRQVADAGKMLALFQQIPIAVHPTDERETAEGILLRYEKQFLNHLRACHEVGLPEDLLRKIQRYILERMQIRRSLPSRVLQHSDFAPWNVMISKEELCLSDFQNFTIGFPYFDAAFFYSSLDLLFRYRTVDRSVVSQLQSLFLDSFLDASLGTGKEMVPPTQESGRLRRRERSGRGGIVRSPHKAGFMGTPKGSANYTEEAGVPSRPNDWGRAGWSGAVCASPPDRLPQMMGDSLYFFKMFRLMHMVYFSQSMLRYQNPFYEPVYAVSCRRFIVDWFNHHLEDE